MLCRYREGMFELRHLAALAAVADEGSFGRAAARLGYTQSTVSQQIAALEKAAGGALFDRPGGPNSVRITPLGAVVLAHGRELLARAEAMTAAVDRFQAGDSRIDIGTFQSVSSTLLPPIIRRLRDEHPGCDLRLVEAELDQPELGDLDLLFFDGRPGGGTEYRKLLDDRYVLVASQRDFPAGPVRLKQLDGLPLVAYPPIFDQGRMEKALQNKGIRPKIVFRTAGNEALLSMVRAGLGAALMPLLAARGAGAFNPGLLADGNHSGAAAQLVDGQELLTVHELRPALPPREIFLLWKAGRTQSPLALRAIEVSVAIAADTTSALDSASPSDD